MRFYLLATAYQSHFLSLSYFICTFLLHLKGLPCIFQFPRIFEKDTFFYRSLDMADDNVQKIRKSKMNNDNAGNTEVAGKQDISAKESLKSESFREMSKFLTQTAPGAFETPSAVGLSKVKITCDSTKIPIIRSNHCKNYISHTDKKQELKKIIPLETILPTESPPLNPEILLRNSQTSDLISALDCCYPQPSQQRCHYPSMDSTPTEMQKLPLKAPDQQNPKKELQNLRKQVNFDINSLKQDSNVSVISPLLECNEEGYENHNKEQQNRHLSDIELLRQVYEELRHKLSQK